MAKENLKELIRSKEPLPDDINLEVEKAASKIFGNRAVEPIERWRIKRLFNKIKLINETDKIAMECNFRAGICTNYHLVRRTDVDGLTIIEDRNI